ncbi:B-cell receptor CD22-like isoform X1 [Dendropsophus ebraccatus]|uniref:B-cell receptor CD22-like isoform X1 n=1 Tax=Dendropsophus ebraccatus TaxID=150705 RepID=UPI003831A20A
MEAVKQVYLLLICQGFYLGSVCQLWTIPAEITALIGSCVEIPCTYYPAGTSGPSSTVWYILNSSEYPEILNTKDSSSIMEEYRGRTSLVPGEKSCTLRIDPVRREDENKHYYPGIAEDKGVNAYQRQAVAVLLHVTDKVNVRILGSGLIPEGEATTIRCTADHSCRSNPPSLKWNKPGKVKKTSVEISGGSWKEESQLTYMPSYVDDESLVQCTATYPNRKKTVRSMTLNIYYAPKNVTVTVIGKDEVMEGSDVTLQCNSFSKPGAFEYEWHKGKEKSRLLERGREIIVRKVTRDMEPYSCTAINSVGRGESALTQIPVLYKVNVQLHGSGDMTEGEAATMRCTVYHTFPSSPPSLQWNKPGEVTHQSVEISGGSWREESQLTYIPSYKDDGSYVQCMATYHNRRQYARSITLNINYAPKNVTVTIGMDDVMEGSDVTLQCNSFSKPDVYYYEWYKGKEKSRLLERGREIIVRKVTRDMEPYSCTARNYVGKGESALTQIPVPYAATGVHITMKNEGEFPALICDFLSSRPDVTHYTWMKDGAILHNETEKTLTLYNNGENNGQYSCIAHNTAGNASCEEIWIKHDGFSISTIILVATSGAICLLLLLLVLLVYCFWRKRCQKLKGNETETSPETTYTDLVKRDIQSDYAQYKPVNSTCVAVNEGYSQYENCSNIYLNVIK